MPGAEEVPEDEVGFWILEDGAHRDSRPGNLALRKAVTPG